MELFICYQSASEATILEGYNTNILGIVDCEEKAKEFCCNDGDSYNKIILNKNSGREVNDISEETIYNVNGKFIYGYQNAIEECENG